MPTRSRQTLLSKKKKETFLTSIATGSTVTEACLAAGISRQYVYAVKDADPTFHAAWDLANEEKKEVFEKELARRALGYEQPLTFKGMRTGDTVTQHSDLLLMFLLKKLDSSYRDNNKVELNVGDRLNELFNAAGLGKQDEPEAVPEPETPESE